MKYFKIIVATFFFAVLYILHAYFLRQGEVSSIYQHTEKSESWNCKSTVVLVDDAPLSRYAQKGMWTKYSNKILEKSPLITSECDSVIFLNNKTERAIDVGDTHYWIGDYQYCLNGVFGREKCISKEEQIFSIQLRKTALEDEKVGVVDRNPIYIHFIDYGK
ncbi:hypothetical protein OH773_16210 [Buttiauxella sp. WJP83]|uniref:hypothetical protein n=1 Tax=Buttiauxella sp. WJP83 TaxID=2986951 RepID=UPI0022DD54D6|nr:hypothetical protein [Buttiauxella sp. WJP83]WBM69700.1 hypothetical protein OH773_16210 [Buttiauxella sp. WJP83]